MKKMPRYKVTIETKDQGLVSRTCRSDSELEGALRMTLLDHERFNEAGTEYGVDPQEEVTAKNVLFVLAELCSNLGDKYFETPHYEKVGAKMRAFLDAAEAFRLEYLHEQHDEDAKSSD